MIAAIFRVAEMTEYLSMCISVMGFLVVDLFPREEINQFVRVSRSMLLNVHKWLILSFLSLVVENY